VLVVAVLLMLFGTNPLVSPQYVARISIDDVILEDADLEHLLADVADDANIKALIVRVNSPGGSTAGSEGIYLALRRVAEQKPVVATMGTLAAAGGYLVSLAADRLIARETTLTGSIGVIMEYAEFSRLFDKLGIGTESIKSAPLKGEPSLTKPLSPEGRKALQTLIDDSYAWFVELVAERRNLPLDTVRTLADGRVYTGRQAVAAGLVDAIGGEEEARMWLETEKGVSADLPVVDVDLTPEERFLKTFVGNSLAAFLPSRRLALDGMVSLWHPMTGTGQQ
jgi:protease-4